jgi:hypothetical protein
LLRREKKRRNGKFSKIASTNMVFKTEEEVFKKPEEVEVKVVLKHLERKLQK